MPDVKLDIGIVVHDEDAARIIFSVAVASKMRLDSNDCERGCALAPALQEKTQ